jgi:hypothetical protein
MNKMTDAQLAEIAASFEADAYNTDFTAEGREGAGLMAKRYRAEEARRALMAYYGPLPTHYADGAPTKAR